MFTERNLIAAVIAVGIWMLCAYIDAKSYANPKMAVICSFFGTLVFNIVFYLFKVF